MERRFTVTSLIRPLFLSRRIAHTFYGKKKPRCTALQLFKKSSECDVCEDVTQFIPVMKICPCPVDAATPLTQTNFHGPLVTVLAGFLC